MRKFWKKAARIEEEKPQETMVEALSEAETESHWDPHITETVLPNFGIGTKGLYVKRKEKGKWEWVCSPIQILAVSRNNQSGQWGRLIRFADLDGRVHMQIISMEDVLKKSNQIISLLAYWGLRMNNRNIIRQALMDYIQDMPVQERVELKEQARVADVPSALPAEIQMEASTARPIFYPIEHRSAEKYVLPIQHPSPKEQVKQQEAGMFARIDACIERMRELEAKKTPPPKRWSTGQPGLGAQLLMGKAAFP